MPPNESSFWSFSLFQLFSTTTNNANHLFPISILFEEQPQNSNNSSPLLNGTRCHPMLFNPSFSVESNPTYEYSICPDSFLVPLFTSLILFISVILTAACALAILFKRKSGHVVARTPFMMMSTLLSSLAFVFISSIRYLVGRKVFPCALFSLTWFLTQPLVTLPTMLRSLRLFVMYKLNLLKTLRRRNSTSLSTFHPFSEKLKHPQKTNAINKSSAIINTTMNNHNNNNNGAQVHLHSEVHTATPRSVKFQITTTERVEQEPQQQESTTTDHHANLPHPLSGLNNNEFSWNDSISDSFDSVSEIASNYEPYSLDDKELRHLRILQFVSSHKFTLLLYSICISCSLGLWILLGAIEEGIHTTNPYQSVIVDDGGLFLFSHGCITNAKGVGIIVSQAGVYILLEIVTLGLCMFADKDTWRIKIETFVAVVFQVLFVIAYGCSLINGYATLLEFIFPSGNIMTTLTLVDVFICVVLPLCYAFISDYKKTQLAEITDIEKVLRNKKLCGQLLEFARMSYCPENILCYKDIVIFERMKSASGRRKMASFILINYLYENSPLELNIPKKEARVEELKLILEKKEVLEKTQLKFIKMHCLTNMKDIFERFKEHYPEVIQFLAQQKQFMTQQ